MSPCGNSPCFPSPFCFFPTLPQQNFVQYRVYALAADGTPEKGSLGPSGVWQAMCAQHFWKFSPQAYTRGMWQWIHIGLAIDKTPSSTCYKKSAFLNFYKNSFPACTYSISNPPDIFIRDNSTIVQFSFLHTIPSLLNNT